MRSWFSPPVPPRRPLAELTFVLGGTIGTLALIAGSGELIVQLAPHWALRLGWVALAITLALALGLGLLIRRWQIRHWQHSPSRPRGNFYVFYAWIFLLVFWLGLSLMLFEFAPTAPTAASLTAPSLLVQLTIPITVALIVALFGPFLTAVGAAAWRRAHTSPESAPKLPQEEAPRALDAQEPPDLSL
jgi:hypothetical protein